MAPDLNTLSPQTSSTPDTQSTTATPNMSFSPEPPRGYGTDGAPASPSPRTSSLQAAATLNAGLQREEPARGSQHFARCFLPPRTLTVNSITEEPSSSQPPPQRERRPSSIPDPNEPSNRRPRHPEPRRNGIRRLERQLPSRQPSLPPLSSTHVRRRPTEPAAFPHTQPRRTPPRTRERARVPGQPPPRRDQPPPGPSPAPAVGRRTLCWLCRRRRLLGAALRLPGLPSAIARLPSPRARLF